MIERELLLPYESIIFNQGFLANFKNKRLLITVSGYLLYLNYKDLTH
jgi:hypothetical protein